jgi:hypothetical protein
VNAIPLRRLQRWFALCVEHPATADIAIASRAGSALVPRALVDGRVIARNPRMDAAAMLQVYNGGYLERLIEVMQSDYGGVQHVLGERAFRALVARYLELHPSRHPNLNQLGLRFPAFVRAQRRLPHRAFVAELARLECAIQVAFDAPEFTPLAVAAIARVPAARHAAARFTANPSLQLFAFAHPVDEYFQAWKDEHPIAVPRARASWLAVYRRNDSVWRQRLARSEFRVLGALVRGRPIAAALALAKQNEPLAAWFEGFARDGFFTRIDA